MGKTWTLVKSASFYVYLNLYSHFYKMEGKMYLKATSRQITEVPWGKQPLNNYMPGQFFEVNLSEDLKKDKIP